MRWRKSPFLLSSTCNISVIKPNVSFRSPGLYGLDHGQEYPCTTSVGAQLHIYTPTCKSVALNIVRFSMLSWAFVGLIQVPCAGLGVSQMCCKACLCPLRSWGGECKDVYQPPCHTQVRAGTGWGQMGYSVDRPMGRVTSLWHVS